MVSPKQSPASKQTSARSGSMIVGLDGSMNQKQAITRVLAEEAFPLILQGEVLFEWSDFTDFTL